MSTDDLPEVRTRLAEQVEEIIDSGTDWTILAENLDVGQYQRHDGHPDWHQGTPFQPMFLAYLWATVEKHAPSSIPTRLRDNPQLAQAFGFNPEALPSTSTCKPTRLTDRFSELESLINRSAEQIRDIAADVGAPIGYQLGTVESCSDGRSQPTERTIDRLLRKKGKEVLRELQANTFPAISLSRPDNAIYDENELLLLEAIAAITQSAANGAGKKLGDSKNPDPELDDPLYEDGPSGEVLLEAMKELSVEQIGTMMNFALKKMYTRAKPRLRELEKQGSTRFSTRAKIALDITYIGYHGERDQMKWVQGAPDSKKYRWCHKFATAVIVGENTHYTIAVCPLGSTEHAPTTDYPGKNRSYYVGDVARRLLSIADEYVNIERVYADREFHSADVLYTLEEKGLDYVIPAVKDRHRIGPLCNRFDELKRGYHEENDTPLHVVKNYPIHGAVKHKVTNTPVETNLVILPPDDDSDPVHRPGTPQPFLTNLDVSGEIALDRRWTKEQIEDYSSRGAIENSYSSIKKAAAWTTSKVFVTRWFHFAFGCLLYNAWLLVDFLTQERIGVITTRKKPRITLSRFLEWLNKVVGTLLE